MKRVEFSTFRANLTELASGGEGIVHEIAGQPQLVFKEYKRIVLPKLNTVALEGLADLESQIPHSDWARIADRTTWPHTLVYDGGQVVGFLMDRIPATYYKKYGLRQSPRTVPCEWNYIIHRGSTSAASMVSEIPTVDVKAILSLIKDLAVTVQVLHRSGVVVGDMSGKNLIWDIAPSPRVLLIDCDSFRLDGRPSTTDAKQSPEWVDPTVGAGQTTMQSDIYKLGLAAFRSLWQATAGDPSPTRLNRDIPDGVSRDLVQLIESSTARSGRPTADDWVQLLDRIDRFGGRPVLGARQVPDPSGPVTRPTVRPKLNLASGSGSQPASPAPGAPPPPPILDPPTLSPPLG